MEQLRAGLFHTQRPTGLSWAEQLMQHQSGLGVQEDAEQTFSVLSAKQEVRLRGHRRAQVLVSARPRPASWSQTLERLRWLR